MVWGVFFLFSERWSSSRRLGAKGGKGIGRGGKWYLKRKKGASEDNGARYSESNPN